MSDDSIDYQRFVEDGLRDAVRRLLAEVAEKGLPGEHSFYLAFETGYPGVVVPRSLRDLYPGEMRIVLQNQFWNLEVEADHFSVELSFNYHRQRLTIPFAALTTFADPSAEFALRFEARRGAGGEPLRPHSSSAAAASGSAAGAGAEGPHPGTRRSGGGSRRNEAGEVIRFDPSRRK